MNSIQKKMRTNFRLASSLILALLILPLAGCDKDDKDKSARLPQVTTSEVDEITATSAKSGGVITVNPEQEILSRGLVWSTSPDPDMENHEGITQDGIGDGSFTSTLTGLEPDTEYFVRAYATSGHGVGYGEVKSFTTQIFLFQIPEDEVIDLGDDFDPWEGVVVQGADISDIQLTTLPEFSNSKVNSYEFIYTLNDLQLARIVKVSAIPLAGTYTVEDTDDDGTSYSPYTIQVTPGNTFDRLELNGWIFSDINVIAEVSGDHIHIPEQQFPDQLTISGSGTYCGAQQNILTINYHVKDYFEEYIGKSVFTRTNQKIEKSKNEGTVQRQGMKAN